MADSLLSYAHGTGSTPLLGETIGANLTRTVERFPEREALVAMQQAARFTYAEFWESVEEIARFRRDAISARCGSVAAGFRGDATPSRCDSVAAGFRGDAIPLRRDSVAWRFRRIEMRG